MKKKMAVPQAREPDGRYTYDGRLDRLCVCGHRFGVHAAVPPYECFVTTFSEDHPDRVREAKPHDCGCEKFRPSRAKKARTP